MQVEYIRDMNHNYLVLSTDEEANTNSYQVRMMTTNIISGMLNCNIRSIDNQVHFYYEITWKQPLSRILENIPVDFERLKMLLIGVYRAINTMHEYLLVTNQLILDPEYIYMDIETHEVFFCYYPFYKEEIEHSFHQLMEYILNKLDHNDSEAVMAGYEIYKMTLEENYSMERIMETLYKKGNQLNYYDTGNVEGSNNESPDYVNYSDRYGGKDNSCVDQHVKRQIDDYNTDMNSSRKCMGDQINISRNNKNEKRETKNMLFPILFTILIGCSVGFAILNEKYLFLKLSITQIGGSLFIILGVLFYIYSWEKEKKSNKENKKHEIEQSGLSKDESPISKLDNILNKIIHQNTYIDGDGVIRKGRDSKKSAYNRKKKSKAHLHKPQGTFRKQVIPEDANMNHCGEDININYLKYTEDRYQKRDTIMNSEKSVRPNLRSVQHIPNGHSSKGYDSNEHNFNPNGGNPHSLNKYELDQQSLDHYNLESQTFGETTMLITSDKRIMHQLQSLQPEEYNDILIEKDITIIGKLDKAVDIVVDNPMISRVHAKIEREDNEYYITDLNSTNGTYVNGHEFKANEKQLINEKDSITLANWTYIFSSVEK